MLAAYSKITLTATVLDSDLPDDPWFAASLRQYFPDRSSQKLGDRLGEPPAAPGDHDDLGRSTTWSTAAA